MRMCDDKAHKAKAGKIADSSISDGDYCSIDLLFEMLERSDWPM